MQAELKQALSQAISECTGGDFQLKSTQAQGGGCIHQAWLVSDSRTSYFVKLNRAACLEMFEAEAAALRELGDTGAIKVPRPLTHGIAHGHSYLVLEALAFGSAKSGAWATMGRQLARLHRKTAQHFGWHRDNHIGSTAQDNAWTDDWPSFFREKRLRPQFELAGRRAYRLLHAEAVLEKVESILADHRPAPSLLHGDLWSGNAGFLDDGSPVLFDPATYYGDRETDLAFTELFGGFPPSFYEAYENEWPLSRGHEVRSKLYNLYHLLNHLNLFGAGYLGQSEFCIEQVLRSDPGSHQ